MRRTMPTALAVCLIAGAALAQTPEVGDTVREKCAEQWPGDYTVQEYCIKQQLKAAGVLRTKYLDRAQELGKDRMAAVDLCLEQWRDPKGRQDFTVSVYCIDKQMQAAQALKLKYLDRAGDLGKERMTIVHRCLGQWRDPKGRQDYAVTLYCADQQMAAYERLRAR